MRIPGKPLLTVIITIVVIVGGFVLLFRSCLSKYDERSALAPALYFEKDGKTIILSIVQFEQATSYSQKGGITQKTVNNNYYIQSNDIATGEKINQKKIKHQSDIKNFPIEMLGSSRDVAWLFIGELMAFDPFSLEKIADVKKLEEKNPALTGKFPKDRQYYQFNTNSGSIYFTATNGTKWKLDTQTFLASPGDPAESGGPLLSQLKEILLLEKINRENSDSLYQQKNFRLGQQYRDNKISFKEYSRITTHYYHERDVLSTQQDSIATARRAIEKKLRDDSNVERIMNNLHHSIQGYTNLKLDQDTINGKWFGMFSPNEFERLSDRYQHSSENDETARRKFYTSSYSFSAKYDDWQINKANAVVTGSDDFLHGGFLVDKDKAMPLHLSNGDYIIISRDQIGSEGKIILARMQTDGKIIWTFATNLSQWIDWHVTSKYLVVSGHTNKNLSSDQLNLLECIDLATGKSNNYDYFLDKVVR